MTWVIGGVASDWLNLDTVSVEKVESTNPRSRRTYTVHIASAPM